jgi:hypothetical protein
MIDEDEMADVGLVGPRSEAGSGDAAGGCQIHRTDGRGSVPPAHADLERASRFLRVRRIRGMRFVGGAERRDE